MRQLSIVEPRLVKVEYPANTYIHKSHMSDTEPASQWMAKNPNVRLLWILTGRGACGRARPYGSRVSTPLGPSPRLEGGWGPGGVAAQGR